ncbi:MAG: Stk1 family PASTA domain-containing Ser/Thr kinase [Lachnospiraceae bacterium]|nr:Stk1 family PASTA domain-containing Ser/Thr kinase [Lachnospiraceae bacterium]
MVKIGMVIGGRYEIQQLIGTGGMSDVYRAKDNKLNRNVAVKVLKQEFSENRDFVAKFRREAEAAANLMHPNIVTVYDVGEDSGISYIVMELVDGYTLKQYIEKKSRLSITECISIAIPIASGIQAAHNNGIIHRDIKPQNVIISKEGNVKVTDFGIAKTTTSNTISSNVMGSVHYTSPEQARGGFSDEKSDIYSLGITLFEMVTGRVPFNGDTTVAIAIKHIQEDMPSPRNFVEDIPVSIEQIILKCTQKSPDRRYQNMGEVIEDLKKAYISPDENFVKIDTYEKNSVTITNMDPIYRRERKENQESEKRADKEKVRINKNRSDLELPRNVKNSEDSEKQNPVRDNRKPVSRNDKNQGPVKKNPSKNQVQKPNPNKTQGPKNQNQQKAQVSNKNNVPVKNYNQNKKSPAPNKKKSNPNADRIKTVVICAFAVAIGILVLILLGNALGIFSEKEDKKQFVTIPTVSRMVSSEARKYLENYNFEVEEEYELSDDVAPNRVIRTEPSAGNNVEKGSKVIMYISMEKDGSLVPDVTGMSEAEATARMENEGYHVEKVLEKSETVPKGNVISQTPEGGTSANGSKNVTLVISDGSAKEKTKMPDLIGKTEEEARSLVASVGMTVTGVMEVYSDTVEVGLVCGQSYTAGSVVKEGSEVTLKLSLGPEPRYYSCNILVQAPEGYSGGTASIVLKTADGTELFNEITSVFPFNINLSQIYAVSKGIVEIRYTIMVEEQVVDENGNVISQMVPKENTFSYEVEFQ